MAANKARKNDRNPHSKKNRPQGIMVHASGSLPDASRRASRAEDPTSIALVTTKIFGSNCKLQSPASRTGCSPHRSCSPAAVARPSLAAPRRGPIRGSPQAASPTAQPARPPRRGRAPPRRRAASPRRARLDERPRPRTRWSATCLDPRSGRSIWKRRRPWPRPSRATPTSRR